MTVDQLIKKLSKMPKDSKVLFPNNDFYIKGIYDVDSVDNEGDGTVLLDSRYKKNYLAESEG